MHALVEYDGSVVRRTPLEEMKFNHTKWLDLENPTPQELDRISSVVKLPKSQLKVFLERDELPRVAEADHFSVIIFKCPAKRDGALTTASVTFLVSEKLLITMHKEPIESITDVLKIKHEDLGKLLHSGTSELLYYLMEKVTNHFFLTLDDVESAINRIEDTVFSNPGQRTVKKIFGLKRTLIFYHKALAANRDVLVSLQKEFGKHIQNKVQHRLTHIYYDVVQLLDVVATYRDVLTGSLDIYLSAVSNNMNAVMKKMAAFGSLVLVPTFVTGLYGMNFRYMPELSWYNGYGFAWFLIIGSVLLLTWYFKRKDWF